jgi:hypothetical protein
MISKNWVAGARKFFDLAAAVDDEPNFLAVLDRLGVVPSAVDLMSLTCE